MALADQSILTSVKRIVNLVEEDTSFDEDIIIHTNACFSTLFQLGVGPKDVAFEIEDAEPTWGEFLGTRTNIGLVKSYVAMYVRLKFDPPATSFGIDGVKTQLQEMEWRLNVMDDTTHVYPSTLTP